MTPVFGENVTLQLLIGDTYYSFLCATDCEFNTSIEMLPITAPDSGTFRRFKPKKEEWSASVSGLTKISNETVLAWFYVLQTSVRRARLPIRFTFTDAEGNSQMITGNVYVKSMGINGPATDYSTATIEFQGDGAYQIAETVDPPPEVIDNVFADWWPMTEGNTYIDGASSVHAYTLESKTVLGVARSGVVYNVITSGTPTNMECKLNNTTGVLSFSTLLPANAGETVWVIFKE